MNCQLNKFYLVVRPPRKTVPARLQWGCVATTRHCTKLQAIKPHGGILSRHRAPDLPRDGSGRGGESSRGQGARGGHGQQDDRGGRSYRGSTGGHSHKPTPKLSELPDLPSLGAVVEEHLGSWAAEGLEADFRAAFNVLPKLCDKKGADQQLGLSLMRRLAAAYLPLVPRLREARSCVGPLWACAKLGYWEGGLAEALLGRLRDGQLLRDAKTTGQDHGLLWWSVSVATAPQRVVDLAAEEVLRTSAACLLELSVDRLESQAWSNILLACARLQYGGYQALLHHLTACLAAKQDANRQELANTLYSLGELAEDCGHEPRRTDLQLLADRVVARLGQENGCDAGRVSSSEPGFSPQHLSNMLLGCAKLGYTNPALLQPLAAAAGQAAPRMNGQDFAHSLYSLAKLGCRNVPYSTAVQQLCSAARRRLQQRPDDFVPQNLSNMLWALAALQPSGWEELARAAAEGCRRRKFAGFKPQELSNSVWALAKLGWAQDQGWYEAAVAPAMQPGAMVDASAQNWSNLWYGLALVRHRPAKGLLRAMVSEQSEAEQPFSRSSKRQQAPLEMFRSGASGQHCANLLWSLAVLGVYEQRLVEALAERLGELLQKDPELLNGQELANSLWSFAVMGPDVLVRMGALVERLLREAVRRWEEARERRDSGAPFIAEGLAQLWQVQQEIECAWGDGGRGDDGDGGPGARSILPGCGSLMAAMRDAAEGKRLEGDSSTSRLQRQVLKALQQLESQQPNGLIVSVRGECPVEGLCGRVDVLVELVGGRRVAVEVDGPIHFLANPPHTRTKDGSTQLRDRQMERVFGVGNVVSVPYWEWITVRNEREREEYLRRLLRLVS